MASKQATICRAAPVIQHRHDTVSTATKETPKIPPSADDYQAPRDGLIGLLSAQLVPYAELMRLHRPAGYYAFYFPHLFGLLFGSALPSTPISLRQLIIAHFILAIGCVLIRGAACTWNDTLDAPFDRQVARCRHRPVARGAVSPMEAHCFTILQSIAGASLLFLLPPVCTPPALLLTITMAVYPFCKRFTNFPQVVLGLSLALAQLIGVAAVGLDSFNLEQIRPGASVALACLYFANVVNTMIYDTVYAHQDLKDDLKAGVMSMAVACRGNSKLILSILVVIEIALLGVSGAYVGSGWTSMSGTLISMTATFVYMIATVNLEDPEDCARWFRWSIYLTGSSLSGGLLVEYLMRLIETS